MAKKYFWPEMLIIMLVGAIMLSGCHRRSESTLVGTWVNTDGLEKQFYNDGRWQVTMEGIPNTRGIYSTNGNTITRIMTHLHGGIFEDLESRWYSENELEAYIYAHDAYTYMVILPFERQTEVYTYSINGNYITFTYTNAGIDENETVTQVFTRK